MPRKPRSQLSRYQKELHRDLQTRKQKNGGFTLRAFSRFLGVSASTIHDVMNGKRHFRPFTAAKVAERLQWPQDLRESMMKTIAIRKKAPFGGATASPPWVFREAMAFDEIAEWHLVAIATLARTESNSADAREIASKLGISTPSAQHALNVLQEKGYISIRSDRMFPVKSMEPVVVQRPSAKIINYQAEILQKAGAALADRHPSRRLSAIRMFPIDPEKLSLLEGVIWKFLLSIEKKAGMTAAKEPYCLALQIFPVAKERG